MAVFFCYKRNVLSDFKIDSKKHEIEAETLIEAAILYHKKVGSWPEEVYMSEKSRKLGEYEALVMRYNSVETQRDRFANSMAEVEKERQEIHETLERLCGAIRQALNEVNTRMAKT